MTRLVPYLTVHDGAAAVAFYAAAFGARETGERYDDGTKIGFVALGIGTDVFYLSDEYHDHGAYAPATVGHSTSAVVLEVDDVDATYAAAVAAGATPDREPTEQDGERRGWLVDPFGHRWALSTPTR
ncbi:VOC family protein [Cellulosimicrobium arenosum]|uniref:VOC family protein n=1 Tax=Cellulosimicrobium arenosum TaxID=2708133 RepID=A0A927J004_9MICO|nr:VOC family protein [Cellulosimicrobium arenosum]MBD8078998.1 VOC family protein [Cellulosimicrobium arenosum]